MGQTRIGWCVSTNGKPGMVWNPVVGCHAVSEGCDNCVARATHEKRHKAYQRGDMRNCEQYAVGFDVVQALGHRLSLPSMWVQPRTVLVNSMGDIFCEGVEDAFRWAILREIAKNPQHLFIVATKRVKEARDWFREVARTGVRWNEERKGEEGSSERVVSILPNLMLMVSVENDARLRERYPLVMSAPVAYRALLCEPLLGEIDIDSMIIETIKQWSLNSHPDNRWCEVYKPDWVIAGCETGPNRRPSKLDWFRRIRDDCWKWGIPFWLEAMQVGMANVVSKQPCLDGQIWQEAADAIELDYRNAEAVV